MSMFGLAIAALTEINGKRVSIDIPAIKRLIRPYNYPFLAVISLLFLVVFISIWQGGDVSYWLRRLRVKMPLLVMPLMFIMFPRFSSKQVFGLFYLLLVCMAVISLGVGVNYLLDMESINTLIKQGKSIPSPVNHIRYSVLVAYGIICGTYLWYKKFYWQFKWERHLILGLTIFLFLFLHLFAVRSGLLVLYATLFVMTIYLMIRSKRLWLGAIVLAVIILTPILSYKYVPSFQAKVLYMDYDRWVYQRGAQDFTADSGRIFSLVVGYELFKKHPVFGLGTGNMKTEVEKAFMEKRPDAPHPLMPHNQALYTLTATGLFGFLVSLFAFLYPLFYKKNYRHPMLLASFTVFLSLFMVEHTLENSAGIAFYVFFLCLLLNWLNKPDVVGCKL